MAEDWRYHVAVEPISLTDNDTDQIDFPSEGVISKMEILVGITNAADIDDEGQRRLAEHITNVALTGDTNDIIHDMNAQQSRLMALDTEQKVPPETFRGYNSATQRTVIPIYPGRYARDDGGAHGQHSWATTVRCEHAQPKVGPNLWLGVLILLIL